MDILTPQQIEEWRNVVIKHFGEEFEKGVFENYKISNKCRVWSKSHGISSSKNEQYCFCSNGVKKQLRKHRVTLAPFHTNDIPDDISQHDVDHNNTNDTNTSLRKRQKVKNQ